MATLNEIVANIRNIAGGGVPSDDDVPSYEQVKFWVNQYRALLIKRDLDKGKSINPDVVSDLGCVELKLVDAAECCDIKAGCVVLKTAVKIPDTIELNQYNAITFVGLIDKATGFQITTPVKAKWTKYNRFTSSAAEAYLLNGHIYITNNKVIRYINIRGIFNDPASLSSFKCADGATPCYTDDSQYPVSDWMIPAMTELIMTKELKYTITLPEDAQNDAKDNKPQMPVK